MIKKRATGSLISMIAGLALTGCTLSQTPQDDLLTQSLASQAQLINQQLPVSDAGISLVRANAQGHQLQIEMYQSDNQIKGEVFIEGYRRQLCQDASVRQRLTQGGQYQLALLTESKQRLVRTIDHCDR